MQIQNTNKNLKRDDLSLERRICLNDDLDALELEVEKINNKLNNINLFLLELELIN